MLRTDRVAVWIFFAAFALLVPSIQFLGYLDELVAVSLLALAITDSVVNRGAWRRYRLLWILGGIMLFYAVYSMTAVSYNSRLAIIIDTLIESKPFITLFVMMAVRPVFTAADKTVLRYIAVFNIIVCAAVLMLPNLYIRLLIQHISYGGIFIYLSVLVFMLCSIEEDGSLPVHRKVIIALLASLGVLSGRSKYYAEYVFLLFFLFAYRPGMLREITPRQIATTLAVVALVAAVTWQKFRYYFLVGNSGATSFDPEVIESFARPVLYATGLLILRDHFPFGTGLASFASFRSIDPYSGVYIEYGIDKVYGLSPSFSSFICDAYYPSLTQFGVAGIALFVWLVVYIIRLLGTLVRVDAARFRFTYAIGMLSLMFVLIESTAGTAMVNCGGVMAMLILGMIAGRARALGESDSQPHSHHLILK